MQRATQRIVIVAAGAAAALLLGLPQAALSIHVPNAPLLPDFIVKEPERLSVLKIQNKLRLRFDNEVGNAHTGPFELVAENVESDCDGDGTVATGERKVAQRVYTDANGNGSFERGIDTVFSDTPAGCVVYHDEPTHHHAHYSDFASYVLVRQSDGVTVAGSSKVTFCIADVWRFRGALAPAPRRASTTAGAAASRRACRSAGATSTRTRRQANTSPWTRETHTSATATTASFRSPTRGDL